VGREPYVCTNYKRKFSRKYDAERHNIAIHNEMAVIYNKKTGWISNKRKTNGNLQRDSSSSLPSSPPQSSTPFSYTKLTSAPDMDNKKMH
jgi:hypothetical protein